ncbi:unnamed protein product [Saccharomyces cerevisiae]|nr:unnamed protein product [Saccharomyces cerevisiae]
MGIVTSRDIQFVEDNSLLVQDVMTKNPVTGAQGITLSEGNEILKKIKKGWSTNSCVGTSMMDRIRTFFLNVSHNSGVSNSCLFK